MSHRRTVSFSTAMRDLKGQRQAATDEARALRELRAVAFPMSGHGDGTISGPLVRERYAAHLPALLAMGQVRWTEGDRLEVLPVGAERFAAPALAA